MKFLESQSKSMGRRLIIAFGGSFVLLSIICGLALYGLIENQLRVQRSFLLRDRLDAIATLLKSSENGREDLIRRIQQQWPQRAGEHVFVQVADADGKVVCSSPGIPNELVEKMTRLQADKPDNRLSLQAMTISGEPQGGRFQAAALKLDNSIGLKNPTIVRVAIGEEQGLDFLANLRETLLGVLSFNLIMSLIAGWIVVRREMLPLSRIAAKISQIDSKNLNARLDDKNLPTEVQTVARAFNNAMDDLAEAINRLSRFSSDIAHELRTPVSNIMGSIEVALAKPRGKEEYCETLESCFEECSRIHRITDSLLFLARTENQNVRPALSEIDLIGEIKSLFEFYQPLAEEAGVHLELTSETANPDVDRLWVEPTLFQRMLGNLIENAIQYSKHGGFVKISSYREGESFFISILDNGIGIPEQDVNRVFERFYRVDPSRSGVSGGAGLGLAIVKSIVELHSGSIQVESILGKGSHFTIRWPAR